MHRIMIMTAVKAYAKGGATFGVIRARGEGQYTGIKGDTFSRDLVKPGSHLSLDVQGDGCIDGTRPDQTTVRTWSLVTNTGFAKMRSEIATTRKVELLPKP